MSLIAIINLVGLMTMTIAMQNERSGFITLVGYVGLVYAFMGDLFIFIEELAWLELGGVLMIIGMNVALVCTKMSDAQPTKA